MGLFESQISVTIALAAATPSAPNFGTPAGLAYHTHNLDMIRTYSDLAGMDADGFDVDEPAYKLAMAILSQNPRPPEFKIIRGTTAVAPVFTLEIVDNTVGRAIGVTLLGPDGVSHSCYHTVTAGETLNQVADAVAALIDALTDIACPNPAAATMTATGGTAGTMWYPSDLVGGKIQHTTADANPEVDLAAARAVDSDWYGISSQYLDPTNIAAIAAYAQANKLLHAYVTQDADNLVSGTGVMDTLRDAGYSRSYGQMALTDPVDYGALALMAQRFTADPGSDSWAYKALEAVDVDVLTDTERGNITANNGNYYISADGVSVTFDGRGANGTFMDLTRGLDWLEADIRQRCAILFVTLPKLPYNRKGIAAVGGEVMASLQAGVRQNFISNDAGFEPRVIVPDLALVSTADKTARLLRGVSFVAYAQGAIHKILINGAVNL